MMLAVFLISLFALILLNVPVALSLSATGAIMMVSSGGAFSPYILASKMLQGCDNFTLLAIPFFMIAGELMNKGGISRKIVVWADTILGHISGGMGYCGVLASMIFAGVSGSAVADTTAVGAVVLPIMKENEYDTAHSTALICSAGCIGPIIPPSVQMILYGVTVGVSIVDLFLGGVIPGVLIGLSLMAFWTVHAHKAGYKKNKRATFSQVFRATADAIWAILLPLVIMYCIVSGVTTPTEAAAIALIYALIVGLFVYRGISVKDLPAIFVEAMQGSAKIMIVVGGATVAAYYITIAHIPEMLAALLISLTTNIYLVVLLLNILLLLVGCVMDSGPAILILAPILLPIITSFNIDPVHFGVVMVVNLCIGLLTPPVGNVLYVGMGLSGLSMGKLARTLVPYLTCMVIVLLLISYVPGLVMFLPNLVDAMGA